MCSSLPVTPVTAVEFSQGQIWQSEVVRMVLSDITYG